MTEEDNQEQYEEQPQQQNYGNYAVPPQIIQPAEKADLIEKIRPDEIVETIRNRLMGKEYKEGKWELVQCLQDRALTEKGAWDISNLMLSVSSRNVSISNLNDVEIKKRIYNICRQAQMMCMKNWMEYGIKGADQLGFVNELVISNTLVTLKQPFNAGVRQMIMGTMSEQRNFNSIEESRGKKSLFSLRR